MTPPKDFLPEWFERELLYASARCREATAGNYTKAYETWRRNDNMLEIPRRLFAVKKDHLQILDMGCGNGYHLLSIYLKFGLHNCRLFGIDMGELDIEFANHLKRFMKIDAIEFKKETAEHTSFPDNTFDIILCSEVLEHAPQPQQCLAEIRRILKPGGSAVFSTPNSDNLVARLGRILKKLSLRSEAPYSFSTEEGEHISVKGVAEWTRLAMQQGLTVKKRLRGSPIWGGGDRYNHRRVFFALVVIADRMLDYLPLTINISENVTYVATKPAD